MYCRKLSFCHNDTPMGESFWQKESLLKFIYSEKATKFYEISTLLLTVCSTVKSKVEISQHFVAFSEYMNFTEVNNITIFNENRKLFNLRSLVKGSSQLRI